MDIKNFVISTTLFILFIAVVSGIGYFSWQYFRKGLQNTQNPIANTANVATDQNTNANQSNNDINETKGKSGNLDTSGIKQDTPVSQGIDSNTVNKNTNQTNPKPKSTTSSTNNSGISQGDQSDVLGIQDTTSTTQKATFTINKPKVKYSDDQVIFDYTFILNASATNKLASGMSYEIDQNSCEKYFDQEEEVFTGSFKRGEIGSGMGIKFELPESLLDQDKEDEDYLVSTNYTIYDINNNIVFTGKTWAPRCD